ncbi:MAG: neutral/alkaline non-lysosomal ceramidase N-terminal domain-containing protein [bacterium]|nr:neutral/alkaline non-lysosomal ceramidase N-terminal domain-containing protein [bacterium]
MRTLLAAAGCVDITPPPGLFMSGFAARVVPAVGSHDPLMARALMLSDGIISLVLISCDLIGFTPACAHAIRARVAARLDIPLLAVMLCCTHTHSAPASMPFRGVMGIVDKSWLDSTITAIVDLAAALPPRLQPALITAASTTVPAIGYNRQDPSRNADDTLRVIAIESHSGARIATIINYATHAVVLGPRNLLFSADFPGVATRAITERHGGVSLYLQGACGDIDPLVYQQRGWGLGTFDDCDAIGTLLADAADNALRSSHPAPLAPLSAYTFPLLLPLDPPPSRDTLLTLIRSFEAQRSASLVPPGNPVEELSATAMLAWAHELSSALDLNRVPSLLPCELHLLHIGNLLIAGAPFELYSDIGRAFVAAAAPRILLCAAYANGLYGYCPTSWAKAQGGYGADSSCRWFPSLLTPLAAGADKLLIQALVSVLSLLPS